ncbi:MAG: phosphate-starvation-inducible PsiE family protein [Steroidobacteraceae bacterium]|jgi:uncharacterized membrane protein (DUF373 family)
MDKLAGLFERGVVGLLMVLLMATIAFGTALVAWSLVDDLRSVREFAAEPKALFDVFGLFVAVLVGVELLKILRHLLASHEVNTALIVQTALMALCNKVITLNLYETSWTTLVGVASLILALAAAMAAVGRMQDSEHSRK